MKDKLLDIAVELQSIAQAGLAYSKDKYDIDRFKRIRELSAEILEEKSELSFDKITDLFCSETGYQTPKLDTRAAIFKDDKVLLVRETDTNKWSMPGGWVDVNQSVKDNTVKEAREEAGLEVEAERVIAIQDRNKHNVPPYAYGITKVFVLCKVIGGEFKANLETDKSEYFSMENLPDLSLEKNTKKQIEMCLKASKDKNWNVIFD